MPIPLFILERIKTAPMNGPQIADAFTKLAQAADAAGVDDCAINIEYVAPQDKLIPGDLIPTVTLSLVRQQTAVDPEAVMIDAESIEVRPMSQPAVEMPNPFYVPAAEAACDEDPYPED